MMTKTTTTIIIRSDFCSVVSLKQPHGDLLTYSLKSHDRPTETVTKMFPFNRIIM